MVCEKFQSRKILLFSWIYQNHKSITIKHLVFHYIFPKIYHRLQKFSDIISSIYKTAKLFSSKSIWYFGRHVRMCVNLLHACVYMHVHATMCAHMCEYACMYICIIHTHTYIHTYVHAYIYIYTCIHVHTVHVHMATHTHTHTPGFPNEI